MSDQTDIIIADPALWRAGDKVTIEGALVDYDKKGTLTLGNTGPFVRSAGGTLMLRDETITVTVRRPVPSLPDKPGDVFYATVDCEPDTQVTVAIADTYFCIFPDSRTWAIREADDIDASSVRRVRLVPEDEQ